MQLTVRCAVDIIYRTDDNVHMVQVKSQENDLVLDASFSKRIDVPGLMGIGSSRNHLTLITHFLQPTRNSRVNVRYGLNGGITELKNILGSMAEVNLCFKMKKLIQKTLFFKQQFN